MPSKLKPIAAEVGRMKPANVSLSNWREPRHIKWALRNFDFMPTINVSRTGPVSTLPQEPRNDIEAFRFEHLGETGTLLEALQGDSVDGYIVVKDGKIAYEKYFGAFRDYDKHLWASSTKSIVGSLFGILVDVYGVDPKKSPADYIDVLKGSAWEASSLRQVLNMVSALDFNEEYDQMVPGSVTMEYFRRLGFVPAWDLLQLDPDASDVARGTRGFLPQFRLNGNLAHGTTFEYHSPNVDIIGWLVEVVTGFTLPEFTRAYLWSKLQTEHDAHFAADNDFNAIATGGFNSTLRDSARFGLFALNHGQVGGEQVVGADWMADTYRLDASDRTAWANSAFVDPNAETYMPDFSGYRSFWWTCDAEKGERAAIGIYGQMVYVNRDANTVIASFSSPNKTSNARRHSFKRVLRGNRALSEAL